MTFQSEESDKPKKLVYLLTQPLLKVWSPFLINVNLKIAYKSSNILRQLLENPRIKC